MRDLNDPHTLDLIDPEPATRGRGRPKKPDALTDAERARRYRERKKQRLADLRDPSKPVTSPSIDLSEIAPWRR